MGHAVPQTPVRLRRFDQRLDQPSSRLASHDEGRCPDWRSGAVLCGVVLHAGLAARFGPSRPARSRAGGLSPQSRAAPPSEQACRASRPRRACNHGCADEDRAGHPGFISSGEGHPSARLGSASSTGPFASSALAQASQADQADKWRRVPLSRNRRRLVRLLSFLERLFQVRLADRGSGAERRAEAASRFNPILKSCPPDPSRSALKA
jgi:hypothetical protein